MTFSQEHRGILAIAVIAVAVGVASYAVVRSDPFAAHVGGAFTLDLSRLYEVDPNLIQFEQTHEFSLALNEVRAIGVGLADTIYVAGDRALHVLSPNGQKRAEISLDGSPSCLAVASSRHDRPGQLYVGNGKRIDVFDTEGRPVNSWNVPNNNAILTSIAVANSDVFVADAGNQVIWRFDTAGNLQGEIGASADGQSQGQFNVPSSYFDLAISPEQLLHVANPGALRIETYTIDGNLEMRWGEAGSRVEDFFGCCNPSQFAVLPKGQIVTSEKGVPRVKVYSEFGELECVVAGPQQLDVAEAELGDPRATTSKAVFDVAADSRGRVLVLDPRRQSVRVFTRRKESH